jgi:RNA polymerase sigma factor (sigma-70 family)
MSVRDLTASVKKDLVRIHIRRFGRISRADFAPIWDYVLAKKTRKVPDWCIDMLSESILRNSGALAPTQISDAELLRQFVKERNDSAFAALFERHGAMVFGVARRLLGDEHRAEDVCQATFLVLARRGAVIQKKQSLAAWLHGVAMRMSHKARADVARMARPDTRKRAQSASPSEELTWSELRTVLDEELERLPTRYRLPLVLCYLEGCTRDEAAERLGWSEQRVKGLLERGRERMRKRLVRRGITIPVSLACTLLLDGRGSALPPLLATQILGASLQYAAGVDLSQCGISEVASALALPGLQSMTSRAARTAGIVVTLLIFAGSVLWAFPAGDADKAATVKSDAPANPGIAPQWKEVKTLDTREFNFGDLHFSADGKKLFRTPNAKQVWCWRTTDWTSKTIKRSARYVGMSLDGLPLGIEIQEGTEKSEHAKLAVVEWESGKIRSQCEIDASPKSGYFARISPDEKTLIVSTESGLLSIDTKSGKQLAKLPNDPPYGYVPMLFSADGKFLAVRNRADIAGRRSGRGVIELYDARSLSRAWRRIPPTIWQQSGWPGVAFCPDRKTLASANLPGPLTKDPDPQRRRLVADSSDRSLYFFDVESGRDLGKLKRNEGNDVFGHFAFFPDGRSIATDWLEQTRSDNQSCEPGIAIYDVASGRENVVLKAGRPQAGQFEFVVSIAVSPDARLLAAALNDGIVKVWRFE